MSDPDVIVERLDRLIVLLEWLVQDRMGRSARDPFYAPDGELTWAQQQQAITQELTQMANELQSNATVSDPSQD